MNDETCTHCGGSGVCKVGLAESNCCHCFGVGKKLPPYPKISREEWDNDT